MRRMLALALSVFSSAYASNKTGDEPGTRIRDATLTSQDRTNPNDTLPHVRDSLPDTSRH